MSEWNDVVTNKGFNPGQRSAMPRASSSGGSLARVNLKGDANEVMIPASKKRNLPRRNAERPGSMRVFEYWCEPIPDASGNLPQQLWDAAHEMQAVWNRMTEAFREVTAPHAEQFNSRRAAVQAPAPNRRRGVVPEPRGLIPSQYYYYLADRF